MQRLYEQQKKLFLLLLDVCTVILQIECIIIKCLLFYFRQFLVTSLSREDQVKKKKKIREIKMHPWTVIQQTFYSNVCLLYVS